jgi:hypothetical protein
MYHSGLNNSSYLTLCDRLSCQELGENFVSIILEEDEDVGQNQNVRNAKIFEKCVKI